MNNALETLFLPFLQGHVHIAPEAPNGFFGAQLHPIMSEMGFKALYLQQDFKPYAARLSEAGHEVHADMPQDNAKFSHAFVLLPKNKIEAHYKIASALRVLTEGGMIIVAADNKAGGSRLSKMLSAFGVSDIDDLSKNKARAAWGIKSKLDEQAIHSALSAGAMQKASHGFISQPGIYGWDKIDKGSELLAAHLPSTLQGVGADFGCGYGYLSHNILQISDKLEALYCIDADRRAVSACQKNLQNAADLNFKWSDITSAAFSLPALDFIVMNPPFHEGKKTDAQIGQAFIETAARSLKKGGSLWMVANAHLPYEKILHRNFNDVKCVVEQRGFKVFHAVR